MKSSQRSSEERHERRFRPWTLLTAISAYVFATYSYKALFLFDAVNYDLGKREYSSERLTAYAAVAASFASLVSFAGVDFARSFLSRRECVERFDPSKHVVGLVTKIICASLMTYQIVACFLAIRGSFEEFSSSGGAETAPSRGLMWGILWVIISQIALLILYRRKRADPSQRLVQSSAGGVFPTRVYASRGGWTSEIVTHVLRGEAFLLLGPYLVLTWRYKTLPESYFRYEPRPVLIDVVAQLVLVDVFTFANHVVQHTMSKMLYVASHKPHHRHLKPVMLDAFDGSFLDTCVLILLPLLSTALSTPWVSTWSYVIFGSSYASYLMLIHSEFEHPWDDFFGRLGILVPADHNVHHALLKYNFAHFFTYWDRLAGTYRPSSTVKCFRDDEGVDGSVKAK